MYELIYKYMYVLVLLYIHRGRLQIESDLQRHSGALFGAEGDTRPWHHSTN